MIYIIYGLRDEAQVKEKRREREREKEKKKRKEKNAKIRWRQLCSTLYKYCISVLYQ